jgi:hypothetical protein
MTDIADQQMREREYGFFETLALHAGQEVA